MLARWWVDGGMVGVEYAPVVKLGIIAVSDGEEKEDVIYKQYANALHLHSGC